MSDLKTVGMRGSFPYRATFQPWLLRSSLLRVRLCIRSKNLHNKKAGYIGRASGFPVTCTRDPGRITCLAPRGYHVPGNTLQLPLLPVVYIPEPVTAPRKLYHRVFMLPFLTLCLEVMFSELQQW